MSAFPRLRALDQLRGVAASAVVVQHCLEFTPLLYKAAPAATFSATYIFQNQLNLGRFGVVLFFLISGFLIPSSLARSDRHAIPRFAIGRFFRLYPLYWTSLLLALPVLVWIAGQPPAITDVLWNVTMVQMAVGAHNILDPYWTLFVELLFYISCVFLFAVGLLHRPRNMLILTVGGGLALALFALVLATYGSHPKAAPFAELTILASYLFFMFVGYRIRVEVDQTGRVGALWIAMFVGLVLLCVVVARESVGRFNPLLSPTSVFLSSMLALLVFLAALSPRTPLSPTMCKLGDWSYGIYLFHPLALILVLAWFARPTDIIESCAFTLAVLVMTVAAGAVGHHLVEQPGIRLGAKVRQSLSGPKTTDKRFNAIL